MSALEYNVAKKGGLHPKGDAFAENRFQGRYMQEKGNTYTIRPAMACGGVGKRRIDLGYYAKDILRVEVLCHQRRPIVVVAGGIHRVGRKGKEICKSRA